MNNKLSIFLLIGQSNMAGRGRLEDVTALQTHNISMFRDGCEFFPTVNQQLKDLVRTLPVYRCVTSKGLTDNGDNVHFNAGALREFGRRYAAGYMNLAQLPDGSK